MVGLEVHLVIAVAVMVVADGVAERVHGEGTGAVVVERVEEVIHLVNTEMASVGLTLHKCLTEAVPVDLALLVGPARQRLGKHGAAVVAGLALDLPQQLVHQHGGLRTSLDHAAMQKDGQGERERGQLGGKRGCIALERERESPRAGVPPTEAAAGGVHEEGRGGGVDVRLEEIAAPLSQIQRAVVWQEL